MISMTFYIQLSNLWKRPQIFWKYICYVTVIESKIPCDFFIGFWKYVKKYEKKSVGVFFVWLVFFQESHITLTVFILWASYSFWSLHSLGRKVTWPHSYAYLSLLLALYFSTITCPNQASNFSFRFSLSLFQSLSHTCSFISILALDDFCHTLKKEEHKMHASSGFQTFPKHSSQSSGEEEQIIAPAEKSNEHDCKTKQEVYCTCEWKQRSVLQYPYVPQTLWEYSIRNNRAKMKRLFCHKFCRWIT